MLMCSLTGTVYHSDGKPATGIRISVLRCSLNDQIIINAPVHYTTNEHGHYDISLPQSSTAYLHSNEIYGLTNTSVIVPNTLMYQLSNSPITGTLTGVVIRHDGNPITNKSVTVYSLSSESIYVTTKPLHYKTGISGDICIPIILNSVVYIQSDIVGLDDSYNRGFYINLNPVQSIASLISG